MPTKKEPTEASITGDLDKTIADEQAKGYVGVRVDPNPDSAYTLQSGPDSPPAVPDDKTRIDQAAKATEEK